MAKISDNSIKKIRENDKTLYFKTPIRFPAKIEQDIRAAAASAGKTLNNFVVSAVCQAAGIPEPEPKPVGRKRKVQAEPKISDNQDA